MKDIHRGTKLKLAVSVGYKAAFNEVHIVSEVTILAFITHLVSCMPKTSKSAIFNIFSDIPMYERSKDGSTASLYQFCYDFLSFATEKI